MPLPLVLEEVRQIPSLTELQIFVSVTVRSVDPFDNFQKKTLSFDHVDQWNIQKHLAKT